jgi:hypothetical protein
MMTTLPCYHNSDWARECPLRLDRNRLRAWVRYFKAVNAKEGLSTVYGDEYDAALRGDPPPRAARRKP